MPTGHDLYGAIPWRRPVLSVQSAPPGTAIAGMRYIVGAVASGEFEGHANHIARYDGTAWKFDVPEAGWRLYDKGADEHKYFTGSAWATWPPSGTGGDTVWGNIGGTIGDQADLGAALAGKSDVGHTHAASDPWTFVKLASDFSTSLATNTNVTDFSFVPAANKTYLVYGTLLLRTATATVGARPGIAWPTGLTDATARIEAANSLTGSALQLFGALTTKNAGSTGLATTTHSHYGGLEAVLIVGASPSGTFQITLASETAGTTVTMKAGSFFMYREI